MRGAADRGEEPNRRTDYDTYCRSHHNGRCKDPSGRVSTLCRSLFARHVILTKHHDWSVFSVNPPPPDLPGTTDRELAGSALLSYRYIGRSGVRDSPHFALPLRSARTTSTLNTSNWAICAPVYEAADDSSSCVPGSAMLPTRCCDYAGTTRPWQRRWCCVNGRRRSWSRPTSAASSGGLPRAG